MVVSRRLSRFREFLNKPQHIRQTKNGEKTDVPIGPRGELYDIDPLTLEPVRRVDEKLPGPSARPSTTVHDALDNDDT